MHHVSVGCQFRHWKLVWIDLWEKLNHKHLKQNWDLVQTIYLNLTGMNCIFVNFSMMCQCIRCVKVYRIIDFKYIRIINNLRKKVLLYFHSFILFQWYSGVVHWVAKAMYTELHRLCTLSCTGYVHQVASALCTGLHN